MICFFQMTHVFFLHPFNFFCQQCLCTTVSFFLHHRAFLLQPLDFFDQPLFILRHGSWDLGFQRLFQSSFKTSYNQSLFQAWFKTSFKSWRRRRTCYVHTVKRVSLSISDAGGKVHGGSRLLVQPIPVLATLWLIPPLKELAFLLGTGQKHPVGILFRTTLLQHGGLATETQKVLPHLEDV